MNRYNRKFCMVSDFHGQYKQVVSLSQRGSSILLVAGDITKNGTLGEIHDFNEFVGTLAFEYIIVTPGHTDIALQNATIVKNILTNCICLIDEYVEIDGKKIYGTPWIYEEKGAFTSLDRDFLEERWNLIPRDTYILLTHSPSYEVQDLDSNGNSIGDKGLLNAMKEVQPRYHVHGHAHCSPSSISYHHETKTTSVYNASVISKYGEIYNHVNEYLTTWSF